MAQIIVLLLSWSLAIMAPEVLAQTAKKAEAAPKATASAPRLELKGLYVGMTFDELQTAYPAFAALCRPGKEGVESCHQYSIMSRPAQSVKFALGYAKGVDGEKSLQKIGNDCPVFELKAVLDANRTIEDLYFLVPEFCFEDLRAALSSKYKKPKSEEKQKITTGGGAQLDDQTVTWEKGTHRLQIKRFFADVKTTYLGIASIPAATSKSKAASEKRDKGI